MRIVYSLIAVVAGLVLPVSALASTHTSNQTVGKGILHKFGRGLSNAAFGWMSYGPEVK